MMAENSRKVAIVGSGLIGRSWSMLFASAGYQVKLYDIVSTQVQNALADIKRQMQELEKTGMLKGKLSASAQYKLITGTTSLTDLVENAFFVLECVPERLDIKRKALGDVDVVMEQSAILASSTSAILPSKLAEGLKHAETFIVTHPINPPYYVPLVELVPSPWTKPEVVKRTRALMIEIGESPVTFSREIPGFAINRLQYALMIECFSLVKEGVMSPEDIDVGFSEGIGRRYAFLGPLETCHLNAEGMKNYLDRYAETIFNVSSDMAPAEKIEGKTADLICQSLLKRIPEDKLIEARAKRDASLIGLAKLIKENPFRP